MRSQLEVIAIEGDDAVLQGVKKSACGSCAGRASCSTMGSWMTRTLQLRAVNSLRAKVGELVEVEVPDRHLLIASALLYGLPLLAFFIGGLLLRALFVALGGFADGGFLLGAVAGLAAAWLLARQVQPAHVVTMVRICAQDMTISVHGEPFTDDSS
ncbi:MAG: SoxR reducing system RseC family protein [Mariprofundales bacterium]